jgi:hypothetical protein
MDLPLGDRLHSLSLPPVPHHANLTQWHNVPSVLPLPHRLQLRFRRVQAPRHPDLDPATSAAARLPDLRLHRRRAHAEAHSRGPLPPAQLVRGAFGPGVLDGRASGSEELRAGAPGVREVRECEDDHEGQSGDLPGPDHGGQYAPRGGDSAEGRRGLGLVHQSQRLRLSAGHAGRCVGVFLCLFVISFWFGIYLSKKKIFLVWEFGDFVFFYFLFLIFFIGFVWLD